MNARVKYANRLAAALLVGGAIAVVATRAAAQQQEDDLEVPSAGADAGAGADGNANANANANADADAVADASPSPSPSTSEALEARVRALEARAAASMPPAAPDDRGAGVRVEREPSLTGGVTGPLGLVFSGYVQGQYEHNQLSEDQLQQGGVVLNQDRFLVRRARLRVDRAWTWASTAIEIDGNTTRGPAFGLRRAEASLLWRNPDRDAPPYVRLTAGLSEIPFGFEMTESSRARFFMERSTGSLALFPGEPDVGVRISGGLGFFRYAVAALNGEPIDDRPGRIAGDPNAAKDIVARVGIDTKATEDLRVSGGVSFLTGKGFHAGKDATKNGVVWRDLNENGSIDNGEITAVPGTAATPAENFSRWAFGADLQLSLVTPIGKSRLYGEVFAAQNADRGLFVADPVALGADVRELGFYIGFLQEIGRYGVIGFRTDHYDPNADLLDKRRGKLVPADASVHTYSPIFGAQLPDRVRVLFQYDAIVDSLARDAQGVPSDLRNDRFTIRVQGEL
ncbi:MAG: phosphate-selective porin [Labilithrix sp.]|nr:phosphate-selective porin [Labilithrix sp.]